IQTGGFGLGAKTPFAYNDVFTIVTVTPEDGVMMKREYIAYIDETRIGTLAQTKKEVTEDPQGTKIIIQPKSTEDIKRFKNTIIETCRFWKVQPEIVADTKIDIKETKWKYLSKTGKWG